MYTWIAKSYQSSLFVHHIWTLNCLSQPLWMSIASTKSYLDDYKSITVYSSEPQRRPTKHIRHALCDWTYNRRRILFDPVFSLQNPGVWNSRSWWLVTYERLDIS